MIFANWNKNAEGRLVAIWNNPAKVEQRSEITSGELSAESLIVEGDDQPGANLALVWSNPHRVVDVAPALFYICRTNEVEHDHEINGQPGAVRVIAYRNRAKLASFRDAINYGNSVGWVPDATNGMEYILNVRGAEKIKYGFGINMDQAISSNLGVFFKAMWSDGRTETYAFGEVDRSIASGVSIKGGNWSRAQDTLGISYLAHFLSKDRREYLEKGGISYFIGDGWLNYRPEQIFETYYNLNITKNLWLTADLQRVWNPAYNADRGPLNIYGARIHAEF